MTGGAAEELLRVLLLRDWNTRLVVASTAMLGLASGATGTFVLLRKRALVGDALAHAMLPGVAAAFLLSVALGGTGKSLPILLLGAFVAGLLGVAAVSAIRAGTRLRDDAALALVLSVFFGAGIVLLSVVQALPTGAAAGLSSFIYGKTASIVRSDLLLLGGAALLALGVLVLLRKELALLCFDEDFAAAQGWPVRRLDLVLMALVALVATIGLQAVGLVLVVALLVIPAAAARFWTDRLDRSLLAASAIGAASGWAGASASALAPRLPAGAVIVLVAAAIFAFSLFAGPARGVLPRLHCARRLARRVRGQHLLRALWELEEQRRADGSAVAVALLRGERAWPGRSLARAIAEARGAGLVRPAGSAALALTAAGRREAARVVRNHRLWELYLIEHADIAPSHVDRDADAIEHVLGADLVARLERALGRPAPAIPPPSPHELT